MTTNFELHECVIFVQSTKIGTHENTAIYRGSTMVSWWSVQWFNTLKLPWLYLAVLKANAVNFYID